MVVGFEIWPTLAGRGRHVLDGGRSIALDDFLSSTDAPLLELLGGSEVFNVAGLIFFDRACSLAVGSVGLVLSTDVLANSCNLLLLLVV